MRVLASLVDAPERLILRRFQTLSLNKGKSSPVLTDGGVNAIYLGPDWSEPEALTFSRIRHGMPEPRVYDWDDATIAGILARSEGDTSAAELDHEGRVWGHDR